MTKLKNKVSSKLVVMFLLQLVAMSFVFVALSDKQTILFIKDFVYSLNLDTNITNIIARSYVAFKMMFDLPSLFGVCVFLIQIVCATWTIEVMLFAICPKKIMIEAENIENPQHKIESVIFAKNFAYLENQRLLNWIYWLTISVERCRVDKIRICTVTNKFFCAVLQIKIAIKKVK